MTCDRGEDLDVLKGVSEVAFEGSISCLFGERLFKEYDKRQEKTLLEIFEQFDGMFELASSSIPHMFLPTFRSSQSTLIEILHEYATSVISEQSKTAPALLRDLISLVEEKEAGSWLLAIMWYVLTSY